MRCMVYVVGVKPVSIIFISSLLQASVWQSDGRAACNFRLSRVSQIFEMVHGTLGVALTFEMSTRA